MIKNIENDGTIQERAMYKTGGTIVFCALIIVVGLIYEYNKGTLLKNDTVFTIAFLVSNALMGLYLGNNLRNVSIKAYNNRKQSVKDYYGKIISEAEQAEEIMVHKQMKKDYPELFK